MPPKLKPLNEEFKLSASDIKMIILMFRHMQSKPTYDAVGLAREYGLKSGGVATTRIGQINTKIRNMAADVYGPKLNPATATAAGEGHPPAGIVKKRSHNDIADKPNKKPKGGNAMADQANDYAADDAPFNLSGGLKKEEDYDDEDGSKKLGLVNGFKDEEA